MTNNFSFTEHQVNRLFPFFILISDKLIVDKSGEAVEKLLPGTGQKLFSENYLIKRPNLTELSFTTLQNLTNQLVIIECMNSRRTLLRGEIEYLPGTNQLLFIGSPWFNSVEDIIENNLSINDFTYHDPLINLLHVLKTHEIANEDLKHLLTTVNTQKKELKKAAAEIHDIALLTMQNPDPLIRISSDGDIVLRNPAGAELAILEYQKKNYTDHELWKLISKRVEIGQERWVFEARSNGKIFSFFCKYLPAEKCFNIYGRDITLQRKNEEELKRISHVASTNTNGVLFTKTDGKITWINDGFCKLTGFTIEEAIGKTPVDLCKGPLTDQKTLEKVFDSFYKQIAFNTEIVYYKKDGSWFWGRSTSQPIKNENGNVVEYFGIIEDITTEKETQQKLKSFENRFRLALEKIGDNVWEHDFKSGQTLFSNSKNNFLGYSFDELSNNEKIWWESIYNEDLALLVENDKKYKNKEIDYHVLEYRMVHKDGSIKWVLDRGVVIEKEEDGTPVKIIGTHADITKQKKLELELIEAKNTAESSTHAKEAFLANMSHEIRTPMNAIMGMASQLKKTSLNQNQQFYLGAILSASDNLLIIINDILDLSKIEAGKLTMEHIGFEPKLVLSRAMQVMMHKAEEKGLTFSNSYCDDKLSPVLLGDPYRLNQILLNLISNAIKFTESGTVDITCKVLNDAVDRQSIMIVVEDTGVGMEDKFSKNLFNKFNQENNAVTRKYGGTGLGMSICKQLIEMMGGTISVESKKGHGTKVSFSIKFKKGMSADLPVKETKEINTDVLSGKKILITDDNDLNRLVASTILENYGADIIEAVNGEQAIERTSHHIPDIVLMDIQMPGIDGFEATKIIRDKGILIPIIALTANAIKGESEKCLAAGMNEYISKPFTEEELVTSIIKWLGKEVITSKKYQTRSNMNKEPLYNLSSIQAISGGNNAFVNKMVNLFCEQTPAMVKEMINACQATELEKMAAIAHKIKPSIDNLNINSLKEIIRNVEKSGKENNKDPNLPTLLQNIDHTIAAVVEEMKKNTPTL